MKNKSEASDLVMNFYAMVKNQFNVTIKTIRTDNGPEFNIESFYSKNGFLHYKSCVETPEQNGIIERKHQHILNVARCLKIQSKLPTIFWPYFIGPVVHVINRLPTPLLRNKILF